MSFMERLAKYDTNNIIQSSETPISYPTGLLTLDYANGYLMKCADSDGTIVDMYPMIGMPAGRTITIAGKSGTGKTTLAIAIAGAIIRDYPESAVVHFDIEQATTNTRVLNVSSITRKDFDTRRYTLNTDVSSVEDIFEAVKLICKIKEGEKKDLYYNTEKRDEFNKEIWSYYPTVIIIDSIISLSSEDVGDGKEMFGATDAMQTARRIKSFYKQIMPMCAKYNITVININHLFKKISVNPYAKEQAQTNYFDIDEYSPGGDGPIVYANTMIKLIASEKRNKEDDGFDGFVAKCKLLKSRTNKAGRLFPMVYDQERGYCPYLTAYEYANSKEVGIIEGRNPYRYFKGYPDFKFDSRKIVEMIGTEKGDEFLRIAHKALEMHLYSMLSTNKTYRDFSLPSEDDEE